MSGGVLDNGTWEVPDDSLWTSACIRAKDRIVLDPVGPDDVLEEGAVVLARCASGRQISCGLFKVSQAGRENDRLLLSPLAGGSLVTARRSDVLGRARALIRGFKAPSRPRRSEAIL